ncbi:hypothetical protein Vretifemale_17096, partial [Volvox reticuliferus]
MTVLWLWTFIGLLLTHSVIAQVKSEIGLFRRRTALSSDLGQGDVDSSASSILGELGKKDETIRYVISKLLFEWNITIGKEGQGLSSNGSAARIAEEHELGAHLHQVLDVTGRLVYIARGCNGSSNGTGPGPSCPMLAPELLQGSTLSFLSSLLRAYPLGPTNREDLVAWAAAATAFLEEHYRLQMQQRNMTQQVADTAADAGARRAVKRAEKAAARKAEREKLKMMRGLMDVDGCGRKGRTRGGGSDNCSSSDGGDSSEEDYVGGLAIRRTLNAVEEPGGGGNGLEHGDGADEDDSPDDDDDDDGDYAAGMDGDNEYADDNLVDPGGPYIPANFTGVQYGSLPMLRRVLLAQLLMGWIKAIHRDVQHSAEVAKVVEEDLTRVVTLLYKIHVESVAQRAIMEYFHISKAGGTSWTAAAGASGCELPRANAARYRAFDDDCRWIDGSLFGHMDVNLRLKGNMQTTIRSCVARLHLALNNGFQYISNEYTLHGGLHTMESTHLCPEFVNVISIREPLERLASNIKYMLVRLRATLFRHGMASEMFTKLFCNASAATWETYAPPVADNYNIRTLVGERAFHSPLYSIGEAHEAVAKQLLIQYDLVLDLNAGENAA